MSEYSDRIGQCTFPQIFITLNNFPGETPAIDSHTLCENAGTIHTNPSVLCHLYKNCSTSTVQWKINLAARVIIIIISSSIAHIQCSMRFTQLKVGVTEKMLLQGAFEDI